MRGVRRYSCAVVLLVLGALLLLLLSAPPPLLLSAPPSPDADVELTPPKINPDPTRLIPTSPRVVYTGEVYVNGFERPHPELCPALGARLQLLILVTSAPEHFQARNAVRRTWGQYAARDGVSIAFMLGTSLPHLNSSLKAEDLLHGDVIIGRYVDSFSNLTLKTLSMLEWVDTYCPRAPRLLKTDDDVFINVQLFLDWVKSPNHVKVTHTIWGSVHNNMKPKRRNSKYIVSMHVYGSDVFPVYTSGAAYLMTSDCVRPLLTAAPSEPYLYIEDVFVTGVLASRLHIRRTHVWRFVDLVLAQKPNTCLARQTFSIHMVMPHQQFALWKSLIDKKTRC